MTAAGMSHPADAAEQSAGSPDAADEVVDSAAPVPSAPSPHLLHDDLLALFKRQRLTPVQRRIAHYLLEHPQETVFLGASELGERAGVSQASVSRFVQALGFDDYPDFVQHLRSMHATHRDDHEPAGTSNRFQDAVSDEIRNLQTLERELREDHVLDHVGASLAASQPLVVLGLRASSDVTGYFAYFAAKIHPDVRLIREAGSRASDLLVHARESGAEWLLAFALPRVPRETVDLMREARRSGYRIACVASDRLGPVVDLADIIIRAPVGTRLVFDSQAAPIVLTAALVDAMAEADPDRTRRRLEAFEQRAAQDRYFMA